MMFWQWTMLKTNDYRSLWEMPRPTLACVSTYKYLFNLHVKGLVLKCVNRLLYFRESLNKIYKLPVRAESMRSSSSFLMYMGLGRDGRSGPSMDKEDSEAEMGDRDQLSDLIGCEEGPMDMDDFFFSFSLSRSLSLSLSRSLSFCFFFSFLCFLCFSPELRVMELM